MLSQGLMHMAKNEGIRGMFRGNWTNCLRIIPNSAIKFLTYEQLTRYSSLAAAALAGKCAHTLTTCEHEASWLHLQGPGTVLSELQLNQLSDAPQA